MMNREDAINDRAVTKTFRGTLFTWSLTERKTFISSLLKALGTCGVTAEVNVYVCFFVF